MARLALAVTPVVDFREISWEGNEALAELAKRFFDDEQTGCRDPFDILAEIEEEQGHPINSK